MVIHPQDKVQKFYNLLKRDQKLFSLGSFIQPNHFDQHVSDIQFLSECIEESVVVELGAGVGQSLLLLAILRPNLRCVAIEKNTRKRGWIQIHKKELGLKNVWVSPSMKDYFHGHAHEPTGLLLKAFSPVKVLPEILEEFKSYIQKLYVIEGKRRGLSSAVSSISFFQTRLEKMPHGQERFLVVFEKTQDVPRGT